MEVWIGRDGQRNGPYREDEVRQWLRDGQVGRDDLGWYEGLAEWQPLGVLFPEAAAAPAEPPPAGTSDAAAPLPASTAVALEDYAGFWKRVVAYIIDAIVLWLPNKLIMDAFGGAEAQATLQQAVQADPHAFMAAYGDFYQAMGPAMAVTWLLAWAYFALCESSAWQATIGKMVMGIRVTDLEGGRISFLRAVGRYAAKFVSALILLIGFMMAGWTRRKQALHDLLANTLVLNGRASEFKPARRSDGTGSLNA